MTATDEIKLREMLDERGIPWRETISGHTGWETEHGDDAVTMGADAGLVLLHAWVTPAQAIAATLMVHSNLNTEGSYACPHCGCVVDYGTRGDGEKIVFMEDYVIPLNHCPNCGAKVVDKEVE